AFDVLHANGRDLMQEPLVKRREHLPKILGEDLNIRLSAHLPGSVADIIEALRAAGIEGVVAKRKDSLYRPGERSSDWWKLKLDREEEFVIGGYRRDGSIGLDALLVGYYNGVQLLFAGKVRAGFIPRLRREVLSKLKPLNIAKCPFANLPDADAGRWGGGV